jgi:hypothetical protein
MEFTTTVSERDFIAAYRLIHKSIFISAWLILLSVFLVWDLFECMVQFFVAPRNAFNDFWILVNVCLLGLIWIYLPYRVRRRYRKDPGQRGEMAVQLGQEGVSERSSLGPNLYYPWSACARWNESSRVFVILTRSGVYFTFPKTCLSAAQQDELRGILAASVPKK